MRAPFEFRGEVIDFEMKEKPWTSSLENEWELLTLVYADGRRVTIIGGDWGNEDPWIEIEGK